MAIELSEGLPAEGDEAMFYGAHLDPVEPFIEAPNEPVIKTESAPRPGALGHELRKLNKLHALNAVSIGDRGHFPGLVVANLRRRHPNSGGWLHTANPGVKVQVARHADPDTGVETALLGFYLDQKPGEVLFEQIGRRYGERVEPVELEYQPFAPGLFEMLDGMTEALTRGNFVHTDPCSFRIPYRRYDIPPKEEAKLIELEAACQNYLDIRFLS